MGKVQWQGGHRHPLVVRAEREDEPGNLPPKIPLPRSGAGTGGRSFVTGQLRVILRGPDLGCESLPGFGCPAAKNVVCVGAAREGVQVR